MAETSFSHSCCCTGVARYQWTCTEPDVDGRRYIPGVRDRGELASGTYAAVLYVYPVGNLDENCHGEVTAIEYCYQYDNNGEGEAVFNWTVLILDSDVPGNFRITNLHVIESHPNSLNCTEGTQRRCCDTNSINGFILPVNFVFGVTGPAQGNTHGATLLGFHESLSQYLVSTSQISRSELQGGVTVGSKFTRRQNIQSLRGLRMLWFVGK